MSVTIYSAALNADDNFSIRTVAATADGTLWTMVKDETNDPLSSFRFLWSTDDGLTWTENESLRIVTTNNHGSFEINAVRDIAVARIHNLNTKSIVGLTTSSTTWVDATTEPATWYGPGDMCVFDKPSSTDFYVASFQEKVGLSRDTLSVSSYTAAGAYIDTHVTNDPNFGALSFSGSVDFHHTGDGHVASATPHLYLAGIKYSTSNEFQFAKATWNGDGTWTIGTVTDLNSTDFGTAYTSCVFDGAQAIVATEWNNRGFIYERDAADTTTIDRTPGFPGNEAGEEFVTGVRLSHQGTDGFTAWVALAGVGQIRFSQFTRSGESWGDYRELDRYPSLDASGFSVMRTGTASGYTAGVWFTPSGTSPDVETNSPSRWEPWPYTTVDVLTSQTASDTVQLHQQSDGTLWTMAEGSGGTQKVFYYSTDQGQTWTPNTNLTFSSTTNRESVSFYIDVNTDRAICTVANTAETVFVVHPISPTATGWETITIGGSMYSTSTTFQLICYPKPGSTNWFAAFLRHDTGDDDVELHVTELTDQNVNVNGSGTCWSVVLETSNAGVGNLVLDWRHDGYGYAVPGVGPDLFSITIDGSAQSDWYRFAYDATAWPGVYYDNSGGFRERFGDVPLQGIRGDGAWDGTRMVVAEQHETLSSIHVVTIYEWEPGDLALTTHEYSQNMGFPVANESSLCVVNPQNGNVHVFIADDQSSTSTSNERGMYHTIYERDTDTWSWQGRTNFEPWPPTQTVESFNIDAIHMPVAGRVFYGLHDDVTGVVSVTYFDLDLGLKNVYAGAEEVSAFYVGGTPVDAVYAGTELVYG